MAATQTMCSLRALSFGGLVIQLSQSYLSNSATLVSHGSQRPIDRVLQNRIAPTGCRFRVLQRLNINVVRRPRSSENDHVWCRSASPFVAEGS